MPHPKSTVPLWLQRVSLIGIILATPFLFWGGPDCDYCLFYQAVWNLGHPLFFGLIMLVVRPWRYVHGWRLWLTITLVAIVAGSLIEYLQGLVGRDVDIHDVYRDLVGTWFILAWLTTPPSRGSNIGWRYHVGYLTRLLASLLLLTELISVSQTGFQQWKVNHQLPSLYDFQQSSNAFEWSGNIRPTHLPGQPDYYPLLAKLKPGHYPSVFLDDMPHDWSGYRRLEISLFNPEKTPLPLTLRINDAQHDRDGSEFSDRFNRRLVLQPGHNRFTVSLEAVKKAPRTRIMNMKQITRLGLFATDLGTPRSFYIRRLNLVH